MTMRLPILLINPNTSRATTDIMLAVAQDAAGDIARVQGATATRGPTMITTFAGLDAAAAEVIGLGMQAAGTVAGVIVGAFGDPGAEALAGRLEVPVVGICEASMIEAASGGRRFAVATTTPEIVDRIAASAARLNLGPSFAGTWLTPGDPYGLVGDPARLEAALAVAVEDCIRDGGADAVIIGGGPLSRAAVALSGRYTIPVVAPVAAAVRWIMAHVSLATASL